MDQGGKLTNFDLGLPPWLQPLAKRLLGLTQAEAVYAALQLCRNEHSGAAPPFEPGYFSARALDELRVNYELPMENILALRQVKGPMLFVANHPFGAIDALLLMALMGEIQRDFKFVGNAILRAIPELIPALIPVQIMDRDQNHCGNHAALRGLIRHLEVGGVAGLFPAGQVAAYDHIFARQPTERDWGSHLGRIVQRTGATVIPVFFEGRASMTFQYAGLVAPTLRIALLVREMLRFRGKLRIQVGEPRPYPKRRAGGGSGQSAAALTAEIRRATFALDPRLSSAVSQEIEG